MSERQTKPTLDRFAWQGKDLELLSLEPQEDQEMAERLQKQLDDPEYWERLTARLERECEAEVAKLLADVGERIGKRLKREMQ